MNSRETIRRPGSAEYQPRTEGLEAGRLETRVRGAMQSGLTDPNSLYRKAPGGFRLQTNYEDRLVDRVMPGLLEDTGGSFPLAIGAIESLRVHQQRVPLSRDLGRAMRDSLEAVQGAIDTRARELVSDSGRRITDDIEQHQIYGLATKLYTFQQEQAARRRIEYREETETDRVATQIAEQLLAATSAEDISYAAKKGRGSLAAEARGRIAAIYHDLADEHQDNPEILTTAWKQAKADLLQFARTQDTQEARAITRTVQSFTGLSNYYADLDAVRQINSEASGSIREVKRLLREAKATPATPKEQQEVETFQEDLAVLAQEEQATVEDLLAETAVALDYRAAIPQATPEAPIELIQAAAEPIVEDLAPAIETRAEEPEPTTAEAAAPLSPRERLVAGATRLWNGIRQAGQAVDRFMHTYEGIDTQAVAADKARPRNEARIRQNAIRFGSGVTALTTASLVALGAFEPGSAVAAERSTGPRHGTDLILDHNPAERAGFGHLTDTQLNQQVAALQRADQLRATNAMSETATISPELRPFLEEIMQKQYDKVLEKVKEQNGEIIIKGMKREWWDTVRHKGMTDPATPFSTPTVWVVPTNDELPAGELIAQRAGITQLNNRDLLGYFHQNNSFDTLNPLYAQYATWDNVNFAELVKMAEDGNLPRMTLELQAKNDPTIRIPYVLIDAKSVDPDPDKARDALNRDLPLDGQDGEFLFTSACHDSTSTNPRDVAIWRIDITQATPEQIQEARRRFEAAQKANAPVVAPAVEQPAAQPVLPVAPRATDDNSEVDDLRKQLQQERDQQKRKAKQKTYTALIPMVQVGSGTTQPEQPTPETQAPMQEAVALPNELTGNIQALIDKLYESGSARSFGNKGGLSEISVLVNSQLLQGALDRSNFGSTDEWLEEMLKNYDAIFANTNAGNERGTVAGLGNGYFIRGRDRAQILDAGWAEKHMPAFDKKTKMINAWDFRPGSVPVVTFRLRMDPKGKITLPDGKHADLLIDSIQYQTPATPSLLN